MKLLTAGALVLAIAFPVAIAATVHDAATGATTLRLPACPQEDSRGCLWDASSSGNNGGHSFWTTRADTVYYIKISRFSRVNEELADALAEGDSPQATTRRWERCYYTRTYSLNYKKARTHKNSMLIACPSGYSEVN